MREGVSACCGYEVVEICEETVSGRVSADERTGLQRVEELARVGVIKKC
ncbi:MAG: hypothetical protein RIS92_97 [Verrucomicrobiota bacterium]|jgi:hypothetical protein